LEKLYLVGRNEASLEELREEITLASPCQVQVARLDLASGEAIVEFASGVNDADLVINCAGFSVVGQVKDVPLEMFRKNMAVNFLGPVILTCEFLKKPVKPRVVVNVLSTTAVAGRRMHGCYSSTKAALWAFTRILRRVTSPEICVLEVLASTFASRFANNTIRVGGPGHKRETVSTRAGRGRGLTSRAVADKIYEAVQTGREYVFVPFAARLFLALETTAPSAFGRLFK
jgi:short-subunit dehydrogenase